MWGKLTLPSTVSHKDVSSHMDSRMKQLARELPPGAQNVSLL